MKTLTLFVPPANAAAAAFVTMPLDATTVAMLKKLQRTLAAVNKVMDPHAAATAVTVDLQYYLTWWRPIVWESDYLTQENGFTVRKGWRPRAILQTDFSVTALHHATYPLDHTPIFTMADSTATIANDRWVHFSARPQYTEDTLTSEPFELAEILAQYAKEGKR